MRLFIPFAILTACIVWAVYEYNHPPAKKSEYYYNGLDLYKQGMYDDAYDMFTKSYTDDATDAVSLFYAGLCKLNLKDTLSGSMLCEKAIEIDPELKKLYFDYGLDRKFNIWEKNISKDEVLTDSLYENLTSLNNKGLDLYNKGYYLSAINYFKKAVKIDSTFSMAYYNMGLCYYYLEDYNNVLESFDKVIKLNPLDTNAYFYSGYAKYELGDYEGAVEDYTEYIKLYPSDYNAYRNRGLAKLTLGDTSGACQDWEKAESMGSDQSDLTEYYCNTDY
ncbi:MAG: hypothetical protein Kow0068_11900 [Marinilabiliales bacterium]